MLKRGFDLLASALGLLVLSPLFLVIAILIKATSPGPVFYRAKRIGQEGKAFGVYKFRSMVKNADKQGPGITVANDCRVTTIGRILRRTKVDELPQLINVVRGEMSLVGPRPEDPEYVELYSPEQRAILQVRPGVTSLASVAYRHEEEQLTGPDWKQHYIDVIMPEKLAIDLEYAQRACLWYDIVIIVRTILWLISSNVTFAFRRLFLQRRAAQSSSVSPSKM